MKEEKKELLEVHYGKEQLYNWHCGPYWSKFLAEIRDNEKIYGIKCPKCGRVYMPPRSVCGRCFTEMNEWVELGNEGVIDGFTVVKFPYINPSTGEMKNIPFTSVWIRLDGADTCLIHYLDEKDEEKIEVGMRVKAVFREDKKGDLYYDIKHFKIVTLSR